MTDEEILMIGRRAMDKCFGKDEQHIYIAREVERRIAEIEREECAKACELIAFAADNRWLSKSSPIDQGKSIAATECAAAIRARGEK